MIKASITIEHRMWRTPCIVRNGSVGIVHHTDTTLGEESKGGGMANIAMEGYVGLEREE